MTQPDNTKNNDNNNDNNINDINDVDNNIAAISAFSKPDTNLNSNINSDINSDINSNNQINNQINNEKNKLNKENKESSTTQTNPPNEQILILKVISHHLETFNKEIRTARRGRWLGKILLWGGLTIFGLSVMGWNSSASDGAITYSHTAVIDIDGEIAGNEMTSAKNIKYSLEQAFKNEEAKGIILRINSPGGSPVQSGMIYDEIKRLKQKYPKKRIYAVVEEMCASGAYYIASAADYIYVDKASIVGSIGVLMDGFGFDKTMNKFGVERRLYTAGVNKGMLDPFSPENPTQKAHILSMLDNIHVQFIDAVKKGRGNRLKFNEHPEMFSGLFWTGEKSIELGLSDGYGYVEDVAKRLVLAEEIVDYTPQEDFTAKIAKRFGASLGMSLNNFGTSMVESAVKETESQSQNIHLK